MQRGPPLMLVHRSDRDENRADPDKTANRNAFGEIHIVRGRTASLTKNPRKNTVEAADPGKRANQTARLHHMTQQWTNRVVAAVLAPARRISLEEPDRNVHHPRRVNRSRKPVQPPARQRLAPIGRGRARVPGPGLMGQRANAIQRRPRHNLLTRWRLHSPKPPHRSIKNPLLHRRSPRPKLHRHHRRPRHHHCRWNRRRHHHRRWSRWRHHHRRWSRTLCSRKWIWRKRKQLIQIPPVMYRWQRLQKRRSLNPLLPNKQTMECDCCRGCYGWDTQTI